MNLDRVRVLDQPDFSPGCVPSPVGLASGRPIESVDRSLPRLYAMLDYGKRAAPWPPQSDGAGASWT